MGLFLDEKDKSSKLVLSHIYLLLGIFYPFWISLSDGILFYFVISKQNSNLLNLLLFDRVQVG